MDNATTDLQNLSILVPRPLLESRLERPDAVHGLIIDGTTPPGQILRDHLIALKESACGLSAAEIPETRSEEHTSELQSLMRISYAVFCLKKKKQPTANIRHNIIDYYTYQCDRVY